MSGFDRRSFLKASMATAAIGAITSCAQAGSNTGITTKPKGKSVMGLVAPKMNEVRVGLIGVGERGSGYVDHFNKIEGARITAICDPDSLVLDRARTKMAEYGNTTAAFYGNGDYAYRELLNRQDVDIVVIATPWKWHHPMAKEIGR